MNRLFFFAIFVLIATAHRLPAPIREEPTPPPKPAKPKAIPTPKPKPKSVSFAGTWSGITNNVCTNDGTNNSIAVTVSISADERTLTLSFSGQVTQRPCYRNGNSLTWNDNNEAVRSTSTLQISSDGRTATYLAKATITTWPSEGTVCTGSGTLARR